MDTSPGPRPWTMDTSPAAVLRCSDQEFDKIISSMNIQTLMETVEHLQQEMAAEQVTFDRLSARMAAIAHHDSPEHAALSADMMACQTNLANLMARNMKCFTQQATNQNQALLQEHSSEENSGNNPSNSETDQKNGDSFPLLVNGHQNKKPSHIPHKHSRRRHCEEDSGEPDIAGYEESLTNSVDVEVDGHIPRDIEIISRRSLHAPDEDHHSRFVTVEHTGETDTDDAVTVEKNRKNEINEAQQDDREKFESVARENFAKLMTFDSEPPERLSESPELKQKSPKQHVVFLNDVTRTESYTEIDVDRIGEEDEGEEEDLSEWKYAGDGDNKPAQAWPFHQNGGAAAHIYPESSKRQRDIRSPEEAIDEEFALKRSSVTMVLRAHPTNEGSPGGVSPPGDSSSSSRDPSHPLSTPPEQPLHINTRDALRASEAAEVDLATDLDSIVTLKEETCRETPVDGGVHAGAESQPTPSDSSPVFIPALRTTPTQNRYPVSQEAAVGIEDRAGGSSDWEAGREAPPPWEEKAGECGSGQGYPTTSSIPAPDIDPQPSPAPPAPLVSRFTASLVTRPSPASSRPDLQEKGAATQQPRATPSGVRFKSVASFQPSQAFVETRPVQGAGRDEASPEADTSAEWQIIDGPEDDMGNALDVGIENGGQKDGEGDTVSLKSAVTPACLPSEGFTADDKVKNRVTLKDWDPMKLMQDLYKIRLAPDEEEDFFEYINMEGYMEKLPINKKKATLLKTWKRRFFKARDGHLYYYEGRDVDKPSGFVQLMGGAVDPLENRMIGIDDGRGRYLVVRAPNDEEFNDWCRALKSQTIENIKAMWVKPVVHAIPSRKRKVVVIDIGSCSVRAGVLGDQPSLPSIFFPCIMSISRDNGERVFGFDALSSESRANSTLSYPVRPSVKIDKSEMAQCDLFAIDMSAMPELFEKIFDELHINPSEHWVMFSAPGNFSDKIKQHFLDILVNRFHVVGVNIVSQTILSLYSYNSRSGIVVDVGERLEIVPVTDGYIVEAGVTRQPYGGHRITEALNSSFTESKYRFFTDVEFQIVRLAMENSCYVAENFNEEMKKCRGNTRAFKKTIHLEKYGLPPGTWKNVTHEASRFKSPEGLFNTELWGMDNPSLHKLVAKAVHVCPMDLRREMWRSIFLSGGVTLLPGFAERLQLELTKLAPPSIRVQVHASPQRYHSAYIGACALANLKEFEHACISADEWRQSGPQCLRKWHMY